MGAIWIPLSLVFAQLFPSIWHFPLLAIFSYPIPLIPSFLIFCSLLPLLQARKAYIPLNSVLVLINHVGEWLTLLCRPPAFGLVKVSSTQTQKQIRTRKFKIFEVEKMGSAALHCFSIFLLFLRLTSGSGIDNKTRLPLKPIIKQSRKFEIQETQRPFLYSDATTIRDTPTTYPTINPTDTTPVVNPSPPTDTTTSPTTPTFTPTTPTTTTPTITPTTPTTTTPTITPTTPTTTTPTITPTTPTTTPTITPTTPTTTPYTSPTTPTTSSGGGSWCVASSSASPTTLQVALDYACGYGGADCSAIQPGATCFNPDTVKDHASYAFNSYYQNNPAPTSCSFGGAAQLTNTDPSSGSCHYPSSSQSTSTTPPTPPTTTTPPTPFMQSPPSPPSPTIMTTPIGGSSVFGEGPAGSPNKAASMDQNSILFLGATIMLMYALLGTHP